MDFIAMTVNHLIPTARHAAHTLPVTTRTALAVCRWWFWALRVDCSGEWDHTISRLDGAIAVCADIDECQELRFLRYLAAEHSERCYGNECAVLADISFLKPQAD